VANQDELEMGKQVEKEHSDTISGLIKELKPELKSEDVNKIIDTTVEKIASDHLKELPNYYTLLKAMESTAKSSKGEKGLSTESKASGMGSSNLAESSSNTVRKDTFNDILDVQPAQVFGEYPTTRPVSTGIEMTSALEPNTMVYVSNCDTGVRPVTFIKEQSNGNYLVQDSEYGKQFEVSKADTLTALDYQNLKLF